MSKERELLEALKESAANDPYVDPNAATDAAQQTANATQQAAQNGGPMDVVDMLDFFATMGNSMAADPVFYLKTLGVLILTVIIIMLAFELIAGS